ncbi:MAG: hypothetical protein HYT27_02020 [Parcubacteria group bacterium]|nr:hypothetical protein [Parcubacteria group bacterium]
MSKDIYKIEHKITTLAQNAVPDKSRNLYHTFSIGNITFEHWDFNIRDGWLENAWLAKGEVLNSSFLKAINSFRRKLWKIVPRIALISQSYIEYHFEPFIVHKEDSDKAFFHCTKDSESGGLMFMENEKQALDELLASTKVPNEFYYYWSDAVNTLGYSAKLLLMFSALEALAKKRDKAKFKKPIDLYSHVLGKRLANKIFTQTIGLRHRLVHGEYLSPKQDSKKNYLDLIHKKVISFFNKKVLSKPLLSENVVNPQRHFYGSKSEWHRFIKKVDKGASFGLKDILNEVKDDHMIVGFRDNKKYELVDVNTHNNLLKLY